MIITTDRLRIREFEKKDVDVLTNKLNNLNISKHILEMPYPYTKKDADWWVKHCGENQKKDLRERYDFAIELKSENELIGGIALSRVNRFQGRGEIGFWLDEKHWRKGVMTEAVKAMIDFAFIKLKLRRIEWFVFEGNTPSEDFAKKMGFTYEGALRKGARAKSTGKIYNEKIYGLLKEEWQG